MAALNPELEILTSRITQANLPENLHIRVQRMLERISALQNIGSVPTQELDLVSKYIDWTLQIPFGKYTPDNLDLNNAKQNLDKNHYGLSNIKENLLEYIASKSLAQQNNSTTVRSPILCFVGVQGIGKTTMARSIAEALGRNCQKIALGAFASIHEIRGRSKGEPGAEPGQITKALIKAQSMNPVIILDEIDKVSDVNGVRLDLMAALLEILDPEQNKEFVDRYLDYPLDLSQVLFITTANNLGGISAALLDRLEVIRFSSYTDEEKQYIAQHYLFPRVMSASGLSPSQLEISPETWTLIIRPLGFDPGIRQLERNLTTLTRKVAKLILEGQTKVVVSPQNFRQFFPEQIAVYS